MMQNLVGHGWPDFPDARDVSRHTLQVGFAAALFAFGVSVAVAADPTDGDARQAISNQGVSIDPSQRAQGDAPISQPDTLVQPADAEMASPGEVRRREPTVIGREVRRASTGQAALLSSSGSSIPWYRTGYGALGIVLTLALCAAWVMRRWLPAARAVDHGILRVVGRTNLTTKHSLALVSVGRRFVVVGISGDRLTALSELHDPEEVAELTARVGQPRGGVGKTGFDEELLSEWQDYQKVPESEGLDPLPGPKVREREVTGLRDLLRRLKAVQTK